MKINTEYYDEKGTIEDMQYSVVWYNDGHGTLSLKGIGVGGWFNTRTEMFNVLDEIVTSYPKTIISFTWGGDKK